MCGGALIGLKRVLGPLELALQTAGRGHLGTNARVFNQGAISPAAINVCPNFKPGFRLLLLIFLYVYLLNEYFAISIFIHLSKASLALSKLGSVPGTWQFSPVTVCYYFQCSPSYQL